MEDNSQAVSFANSYFSLVDGLAPGLENYLAENVVLDWFGRTIRGRKNVAEFMKAHKVGSRHIFNNIKPVHDINYQKFQQTNRKISMAKTDNYVSSLLKKELNFEKLSIEDSPEFDPENNNVVKAPLNHHQNHHYHQSDDVIDFDGNYPQKTHEDVSTTYDLGENDLANLFALEITPTRETEIEEDIKQIKRVGSSLEEWNSSVKYMEANGHIEFSKKSNKRGTDLQKWRRQSRLQIAYSLITTEDLLCASEYKIDEPREMETDEIMSLLSRPGQKTANKLIPRLLPSLGEITKISNNLVPNNEENNFGGYFSSLDYAEDRDLFLDNFNAELNVNNSTACLRTPQYIRNRLVFADVDNKPCGEARFTDACARGRAGADKREGNRFVFNYFIHLIIYQGNTKCRRSLSREFEFSNKNKKRLLSEIQEL